MAHQRENPEELWAEYQQLKKDSNDKYEHYQQLRDEADRAASAADAALDVWQRSSHRRAEAFDFLVKVQGKGRKLAA